MPSTIGKIYKVKNFKKCWNFKENDGKYVKLLRADDGGRLKYEILDKDKQHIDNCACFTADDLIPLKKDWDNLEVNDVIERKSDKKWVLGICGRGILVSMQNNKDEGWGIMTKEELISLGYSIVQSQQEPLKKTVDDVLAQLTPEDKEIIKSALK